MNRFWGSPLKGNRQLGMVQFYSILPGWHLSFGAFCQGLLGLNNFLPTDPQKKVSVSLLAGTRQVRLEPHGHLLRGRALGRASERASERANATKWRAKKRRADFVFFWLNGWTKASPLVWEGNELTLFSIIMLLFFATWHVHFQALILVRPTGLMEAWSAKTFLNWFCKSCATSRLFFASGEC